MFGADCDICTPNAGGPRASAQSPVRRAGSYRQPGCDVTLLEPAPVPLAQTVGIEVGQVLADVHRERGVDLRTGVTVTEVTEAGVRLAAGETVEGDEVLVAVGSSPNTDWLAHSGLTVDDGVVCDAYRRATPDVYAAGDVARWHHPLFGVPMRIGHRTNAAEQGMAAARNLLAAPQAREPFAPVPYFWSDQYDMRIQGRYAAQGRQTVASGDRCPSPPGRMKAARTSPCGRPPGSVGIRHG